MQPNYIFIVVLIGIYMLVNISMGFWGHGTFCWHYSIIGESKAASEKPSYSEMETIWQLAISFWSAHLNESFPLLRRYEFLGKCPYNFNQDTNIV